MKDIYLIFIISFQALCIPFPHRELRQSETIGIISQSDIPLNKVIIKRCRLHSTNETCSTTVTFADGKFLFSKEYEYFFFLWLGDRSTGSDYTFELYSGEKRYQIIKWTNHTGYIAPEHISIFCNFARLPISSQYLEIRKFRLNKYERTDKCSYPFRELNLPPFCYSCI